jgi:hypothetical protein
VSDRISEFRFPRPQELLPAAVLRSQRSSFDPKEMDLRDVFYKAHEENLTFTINSRRSSITASNKES